MLISSRDGVGRGWVGCGGVIGVGAVVGWVGMGWLG